jgi:hypothetical protein
MALFFGKLEKSWLRDLIVDHIVWNEEYVIKAEFGVLEMMLIQALGEADQEFYCHNDLPNEFWKAIIKELDEDLC